MLYKKLCIYPSYVGNRINILNSNYLLTGTWTFVTSEDYVTILCNNIWLFNIYELET